MHVELLELLTGDREVLTGVEVVGVLDKVLADSGGHGESAIAIDVDLADSAADGLADLSLGDTDGVVELAAVLVDGGDVLLRDRGGTVHDDGEAGDALLDLVEDVETELGVGAGLELVGAVGGADGDGEGVNTSALDKVLDLLGASVVVDLGLDVVLDTGENAELTLDGDVAGVGVLDDLLGEGDVLLVGEGGAVDHDVGEAGLDARDNELEAVTVVKVEADGDALAVLGDLLGVLNSTLGHVAEEGLVGVVAGTLGNLEDDGALGLDAGRDDGLHLLHVVEVEGGDGEATLDGVLEHLAGVHKTELFVGNHCCCLN